MVPPPGKELITMTAHSIPLQRTGKFLTPGVWVLLIFMAAGAVFAAIRYIFGLHAATNLSDTFPWGIWKAVNVGAVAAAGSSGFTLTAIVHVFHKEKYHSMMRPSLVIAMLCYTFVGVALIVDIGKYYDIWHPILPSMWQPNSALFEVAICVMCYLTVLYIEFAPVAFERFMGRANMKGALKPFNKVAEIFMRGGDAFLKRAISAVMLLGIVLCCLHQSTLGTLMIIPQYKMHALWHTPALPLLFLLSATLVGLASAIAVCLWSAWAFDYKPDMRMMSDFSKSVPIVGGVYLAVRLIDIALRDNLWMMFDGSARSIFFLVETLGGVALPCAMLFFESVRRSPALSLAASLLLVAGISFNRVNTYLTAYMPQFANSHYFPSFGEVAVCLAQIAAIIFLYRLIAFIFPIAGGEAINKRSGVTT